MAKFVYANIFFGKITKEPEQVPQVVLLYLF
jgi:hypothetical protein